jgi:hypothetical protein
MVRYGIPDDEELSTPNTYNSNPHIPTPTRIEYVSLDPSSYVPLFSSITSVQQLPGVDENHPLDRIIYFLSLCPFVFIVVMTPWVLIECVFYLCFTFFIVMGILLTLQVFIMDTRSAILDARDWFRRTYKTLDHFQQYLFCIFAKQENRLYNKKFQYPLQFFLSTVRFSLNTKTINSLRSDFCVQE